MALSNALAKNDTPSTSLDVQATATFVPGEGITAMDLEVTASVERINAGEFQELARTAKDGCPVSQALAGNVPISLVAALA
jgi:osmotically inducible protein OsmC